MAEYEDNRSVSETGAVDKAANLVVKAAKFGDYAVSYNPIITPLNALGAAWGMVTWLGTSAINSVSNFFFGAKAIAESTPVSFLSDSFSRGSFYGGGFFAGLIGAGRGIQAVSELSKGNKLKAVNTTIKGAVEAAVVFAMWGLPGMIIEPLSLLATGKAFSTQAGEAVAKVAENIEESFIASNVEKKTADLKKQLADRPLPQPQPVYYQQPIIMQPQMVAQNMQPVVLPSQPVIPNQTMPYVVQQAVSAPAGFTPEAANPKPANYWTNYVAGEKVANQNKAPVAAVPQEAAAFSHAVRLAEQKAQSSQAGIQQPA